MTRALADRLGDGGLSPRLRILVSLKAAAFAGDGPAIATAVDLGRQQQLHRADLEETLLQGVLFYGFPRSVTAFGILEEHWPRAEDSAPGTLPRERWETAGRELFDAIYDRNADAVHAMLRHYHVDFHDFVLESAYGRVLARPGLTAREREILACATLAAMEQIPQMVAHGRGARRFGASSEELREALRTVGIEGDDLEHHLRRIG